MSSRNDEIEITITLVSPVGMSESISVGHTSTSLQDLTEWAKALFGLESPFTLRKDGTELSTLSQTLQQAGIVHGDLLAVHVAQREPSPRRVTVPAPSGGLDFSSLLAAAPSPAATSTSSTAAPPPVYYPGMQLDDAMSHNPHPETFISLIQQHESLFKELNYHQPRLAARLTNKSLQEATSIWLEELVKGGIRSALQKTETYHKEASFTKRLEANPNDEEARAYFDSQKAQGEIMSQYYQVMNEYPESMGRVLMLYISCKVNGHDIQAFVDSGAQSTIMSKNKAIECGILHLVDKRFEGVAVGVGTGKILGRIHLVSLQIGPSHFPCTVTVMDDGGLGSKDMDFLLGLDMLKRHLCHIDLEHHCVKFQLAPGKYYEAPFLHEKDLDESKGGTKGFDADKANEKLLKQNDDGDDDDKMGEDN
jgi:DNA damage-inducible protein 1